MSICINEIPESGELLKKVETMNALGSRPTGSAAHSEFIEQLKSEIRAMGQELYVDPYRFDRWEEKCSKLTLHGEEGDYEIPLSSVFPYSGETSPEGVSGKLFRVWDKLISFVGHEDEIAVVKVGNISAPSTVAFDRRSSFPEGLELPENYEGPVATAFINFPFLKAAKMAGIKAAVCVWEGLTDECVAGQYLPFILDYQGIPAVWVNETDGERLLEAADDELSATLVLDAQIEQGAKTQTFYSIIEGEDSSRAVIINTHTDGTNCIEENGALALVEMMKYFLKHKPRKTLIFLFATGHFRLPSFKEQEGGGVQATSKWLAAHRDLWDGKRGHIKAVAGVSVEHLGSKMWREVDGEYRQTGEVEVELCYTGNEALDQIYYEALEGRTLVNTITLRGHNMLHFGEGQPLFNVGIPEIALVTAPDCLCVVSKNHEMDKFSPQLMREQLVTFIKIVLRLDEMTDEEIGRCDKYSLLLPNASEMIKRGRLFFKK